MDEATPVREQENPQAQTLFNKGFAAFERGNLDIAIDLLLRCVELSPSFTRARRFLRASEIQKSKKAPVSPLRRALNEMLFLLPNQIQIMTLLKGNKPEKALLAAEKLLCIDPLSLKSIYLLVDAADACNLLDVGILTLEAASECLPDNIALTERLGRAYSKSGEFGKARDCFIKLVAARPTDANALQLLKDAEARDSMKTGGWEDAAGKKDGYRDLMRDREQAEKLDIRAKAQVVADDAAALIAEAKAKIAVEPNNINYYRALSRLYIQQKRYPEAIDILEKARAIATADPELDRSLAAVRIQEYAAQITVLRAKGDEAGAEKLEQEKKQFMFDDLVARVERFPNDLRLRYEMGVLYCEYERFDDAILHLQLAQRSPKERTDALYYLARCFRAKGQGDMALMQLETALEQLPIMDDNRKKVLFDLGELYEEAGNAEKAFTCYREVYGADIAFRDIGSKMERIYKLRQQSQQK